MIKQTELTKNEQTIVAVYDAHFEDGMCFRIGVLHVTKILPYDENGESAYVPRVAVYQGDKISFTLPITNLVIEYADRK